MAKNKGYDVRTVIRGSSSFLVILVVLSVQALGSVKDSAPSVIVQQLGSDDFTVRHRVTRQLLADLTLTPQTVARLFAATRTPEQRHRLLEIARHHTLRALCDRTFTKPSSAAIGFKPEPLPPGAVPELGRSAVRVVATLPGFPGHAHLESGDLIVEIDGQPLPKSLSLEVFMNMLKQCTVGDVVVLTIYRNGEQRKISMRFASYEALTRMYSEQGLGLRRPFLDQWRQARDKLLLAAPEVPVLRVPEGPK